MGDDTNKPWRETLDDRTRKHVEYARHYAEHYAHGAPGHLDLMTIAALAARLDELEQIMIIREQRAGHSLLTPAVVTPPSDPNRPIQPRGPKSFA